MSIEVGKYYRIRCGGAIKLDEISYLMNWEDDGKSNDDKRFDIVLEITEEQYNAIVNWEDGNE